MKEKNKIPFVSILNFLNVDFTPGFVLVFVQQQYCGNYTKLLFFQINNF